MHHQIQASSRSQFDFKIIILFGLFDAIIIQMVFGRKKKEDINVLTKKH